MAKRRGLLIDVQAQEVREVAFPLRLALFSEAMRVQLQVPNEEACPKNNWAHFCKCAWLNTIHIPETAALFEQITGRQWRGRIHLWMPNQEVIGTAGASFSLPRS